MANFALRYRPQHLSEMIGQPHLLGQNAPLYRLVTKRALQHSFFYGPPGVGKTTLARLIANMCDYPFYELNATTLKVDQLRTIFGRHAQALQKPLIFIDEVHRLSKTQQEVLLPFMERYEGLVFGASTENPYFSLTPAIRSRSMLFAFKPLSPDALEVLLSRVVEAEAITLTPEARAYLLRSSGGDARAMLNLLEAAAAVADGAIDASLLQALRSESVQEGAKSQESHYNLISAMIKSMRGSDIDAALYWMARLIEGGEPPEYLARRMVIFSAEDIGNANPNALGIATDAMYAVKHIGYPEARIILAQALIYLTASPKSHAAYRAIDRAIDRVRSGDQAPVPEHLRSPHPKGYHYPHDFGGWVAQRYWHGGDQFYHPRGIGFEKRLQEWLEHIKRASWPVEKEKGRKDTSTKSESP